MARLILTTPGEDTPAGGNSDVIGTPSPNEVITVISPANLIFDPSFNQGGDTIDLPGNAEDYTATRTGSGVTLTSTVNNVTIFLPVGTAPNTLVFDNATRQISFQGTPAQLVIGTQVIDNPGGEPLDPGAVSFFELTQGSDTDPDFTGTPGDDTYRADLIQTALLPIQTLTNGDDFNAGDGFDRLFAQVVNDVTPAGLLNLEEIIFEGANGIIPPFLPPVDVDLINANALQSLAFQQLTNDINVDNITTTLRQLRFTDSQGGINIDIEFDGAAVTAGDDILDIQLDNFDGNIDLDGDPGQVYGTININSLGGSSENDVDIDGSVAGAPDVNVTGNSDLDLTGDINDFSTLRNFDASALDANLRSVFTGGTAADVNVFGAAGDNLLIFNNNGAGLLTIETQGGDDTVFINNIGADVDADLGDGANLFDIDGDTSGNVSVVAGDGDDEFRIQDTVSGDLTVDTGDGGNLVEVDEVAGVIDITGGAGDDTFSFFADGSDGLHTFEGDDTLNGGGGNDLAEFEATNDNDGGTSSRNLFNGGTITNTETLRHIGNIGGGFDLTVDLDGVDNTATRFELAGTYTDDVNILNMDGETIAVLSDIPGELLLDNAVLTIDDYTVELTGGVTVGELDLQDHGPSDEADRVTIISTGLTANLIEDASQIDTDLLVLTGVQDILLGRIDAGGSATDEQRAFDSAFGGGFQTIINAIGAAGDDVLAVEGGVQIVNDGDGNDILAVFDTTFGDADVFNMDNGSNALWVFDFLSVGFGDTPDLLHQVTGFDVGGDSADVVAFDPISPGGTNDFFQTDGDLVVDGETVVIRNVEVGDEIDLTLSNVNFIKFTTQVTGGATIQDAFTQALGAGFIQVNALVEEVLAAYYDAELGGAVFVTLSEGGGFLSSIDDGAAFVEMSYAEFLALDGDNVVFSDNVLDVQAQLDANDVGAIAAPAEFAAAAPVGPSLAFSGFQGDWSHHIV